MSEYSSFTWGLDELENEIGHVQVFNFMLESYTELGLSHREMLFLIHISSYKYNVERGISRPSLETISKRMGYNHRQRAAEIANDLEAKAMLVIERRPGQTSIYNGKPFALKALAFYRKNNPPTEKRTGTEKRTPIDEPVRNSVHLPVRKSVHEEEEYNKNKKEKESANFSQNLENETLEAIRKSSRGKTDKAPARATDTRTLEEAAYGVPPKDLKEYLADWLPADITGELYPLWRAWCNLIMRPRPNKILLKGDKKWIPEIRELHKMGYTDRDINTISQGLTADDYTYISGPASLKNRLARHNMAKVRNSGTTRKIGL